LPWRGLGARSETGACRRADRNLDSATSDAIHELFFKSTVSTDDHRRRHPQPAFAERMPRVVRMRDGRVEFDDVAETSSLPKPRQVPIPSHK